MLNLNTLLTGQTYGGTWKLISYPTSPPYLYEGPTGTLCTNCTDPYYFDTNCIPPGQYTFEYTVTNSCGSNYVQVSITINESGEILPIPTVAQCTLCSTPQSVTVPIQVKRKCFGSNLPTPFSWTLVSMPGSTLITSGTANTNPFSINFTPSANNYRVNITGCNVFKDFTIGHFDSQAINANVSWLNYSSYAVNNSQYLQGRASITKTVCTDTTTVDNNTFGDWTYQTTLSFTLTTGGSVVSVTLYKQDLTFTTFTLSSHLTGCGGTVNISDLTFNGTNSTDVANAVQNCLKNATSCNIDVSCSFGAEGNFTLSTGAKHNPTLWWGLKKSTSVLTTSSTTFTTGPGFGVKLAGTRTYSWTELIQGSPCPTVNSTATKVYANNGQLSALLNLSNCDFNYLDVNNTPVTIFTTTSNLTPSVQCC